MQKGEKNDEEILVQHLPGWARILRKMMMEEVRPTGGSTYATTTVAIY